MRLFFVAMEINDIRSSALSFLYRQARCSPFERNIFQTPLLTLTILHTRQVTAPEAEGTHAMHSTPHMAIFLIQLSTFRTVRKDPSHPSATADFIHGTMNPQQKLETAVCDSLGLQDLTLPCSSQITHSFP